MAVDTESAEATALATELVTAESVATELDTAVLLPSHSRQPIKPKPHKMPNTPLQRKLLNKPNHRWPRRPLMQPIRFLKSLFIQIANLTELILAFITIHSRCDNSICFNIKSGSSCCRCSTGPSCTDCPSW